MSNSQELPAGVPELTEFEMPFNGATYTVYAGPRDLVAYRLGAQRGYEAGRSDYMEGIEEGIKVGAQRASDARWIPVGERLPDLGQSVALIDANGWENTGGDLDMNIRACGYLSDAGPFKYWSIRGERATNLNAFTHWLAIPTPPKDPA